MLESYDDCNFFVQSGTKRMLFKCHNGVETDNRKILDAQTAMTTLLSSRGIRTQSAVPAVSGDVIVEASALLSPLRTTSFAKTRRDAAAGHRLHAIWRADNTQQHLGAVLPILFLFLYIFFADMQCMGGIFYNTQAEVPVTGGYERLVGLRVFEWVEGKPLVGIATPNLLVLWGQTLGKVQAVLKEGPFDHEGLHRYHQWDLRNTADLRTFVPCIPDEKRRGIVGSVIDAFEASLSEMEATLDKSALQADFNDANLILGADGKLGVIDFGDIVQSWSVCEIAIGAAYATVSSYGHKNPLGAAAALLRGVSETLTISQAERKYIRLLAACRLAISVTLGAYSYQLQPECSYLLLHSEPGWNSLDALWVTSSEEDVADLFANALGKTASLDALQTQGAAVGDASRKKARVA